MADDIERSFEPFPRSHSQHFLFYEDEFLRPNPFTADIVVSIDDVADANTAAAVAFRASHNARSGWHPGWENRRGPGERGQKLPKLSLLRARAGVNWPEMNPTQKQFCLNRGA